MALLGAEAERQRLNAQQLVSVLRSVDAAVLAVDVENRRIFANPAADQLLPSLPRLPQLQEDAAAVMATGKPWHGRRELADGRTLEVHVTPLVHPPGCVLVARDLTSLARLETVRQDFVAGISHELRTPLSSVAGYAELLRDEPDAERRAAYAGAIIRNAARLTRLAQDLVTLSAVETGAYPFQFEAVEIRAAVAAAIEVLRPLAAQRQCELRVGRLEEARVRADREALHRVLQNLIENALVHGGRDLEPDVVLRVEISGERQHSFYLLRVRDNGVGIGSTDQPRVFERFYRGRRHPEETHGTGLGLALVKHMVREHGGSITLESELGAGSTFGLRLPLMTNGSDPATSGEPRS